MSGQPDALEFHFFGAPTSGRKITRVAVSVKKRLLGIVVKRLRTRMNSEQAHSYRGARRLDWVSRRIFGDQRLPGFIDKPGQPMPVASGC
jgi:hypothetical protein